VFMIRVESKEDASTRAKPLNWFNFSRLDITWTIRLHLRCQILCMFLFLASLHWNVVSIYMFWFCKIISNELQSVNLFDFCLSTQIWILYCLCSLSSQTSAVGLFQLTKTSLRLLLT
jgi:hypothetical protein